MGMHGGGFQISKISSPLGTCIVLFGIQTLVYQKTNCFFHFLLPFNLPFSQHAEEVCTANETLMWNYLLKNSSLGIFELVD